MFKNIAPDKWRHFWVGIPMGIFLQLVAAWILPASLTTVTIVAFISVVAISYGFELFSLVTKIGHYDFYDAVASVIGGTLGIGIALPFLL
ncbi:MAG: hypothetical protein KIT80_19955 [Chitinophagaceae bacterium]|nr:hypothetical protein [Chitinophagaceae bacterium]MCW5929205.1 hypothetical protein [Chitinophagaceae bacterium]